MPWATPAEVVEITGITVDDEQLGRAQTTIELFVGRIESELSTANMSAMSLAWLKRAVAYQAAWMADQPDLFTHKAVNRVSQDGASVDLKPDAQMLAPFAKRALKKLGWKGTRSIYTPTSVGVTSSYYPGSEDVAGVHDFPDDPWRPL